MATSKNNQTTYKDAQTTSENTQTQTTSENTQSTSENKESNVPGFNDSDIAILYSLSIQELRELRSLLNENVETKNEEEFKECVVKVDKIDSII